VKLFLLIAIISSTEGFYGFRMASKSASAAIHMERFMTESNCKKAGETFTSIAPISSSYRCIKLDKKLSLNDLVNPPIIFIYSRYSITPSLGIQGKSLKVL